MQSGSSDGSGTSDRSRSWRAASRSASEPELSWSSATWRISFRFSAEIGGGGGPEGGMEKLDGGSETDGCWEKTGE